MEGEKDFDKMMEITTRDILEHYEHLVQIAGFNKFNTTYGNDLNTKEKVKKFLEKKWQLKK